MLKRFMSIILTAVMVLSLTGYVNVNAESNEENNINSEEVSTQDTEYKLLMKAEKLVINELTSGSLKYDSINVNQGNTTTTYNGYKINVSSVINSEDEFEKIELLSKFSPYLSYALGGYFSLVNSTSTINNKKTYYLFIPTKEEYSTEYFKDKFNEVETKLSTITGIVNDKMSDVEKALAIHDYIVLNGEYDSDVASNISTSTTSISFTSAGLIMNNKGVCDSYANAYRYIMNLVGVECYYVTGVLVSNESVNHAWNLVKIGDTCYYVDCTSDDPLPDQFGLVSHDQFLIGTNKLTDETANSYHANIVNPSEVDETIISEKDYDDNLSSITSPVCFDSDNNWYYISGKSIMKKTSGTIKEIKNNIGRWYVFNNKSYVYGGYYSGLFIDGNSLYYNTYNHIIKMNLDGTKEQIIVEPDLTKGYIYGIRLNGSNIEYVLKETPTGSVKDKGYFDIDKEIALESLSLNKQTLALEKSKSEKLVASFNPTNATNQEVIWTSSDTSVATVDENGNVIAVNKGTATIIVKSKVDNTIKAECKVTVTIPATSIELTKKTIEVNVGESLDLKTLVKVTPSDTTDELEWIKSDKEHNISLSSDGIVTGINTCVGASVYVSIPNGEYKVFTVNVNAPLKDVKFDSTNKNINVGESFDLNYSLDPVGYSDVISSYTLNYDKSVLGITAQNNQKITFKGLKAGNITISLIIKTSNGKTFSATCNVTVVNPTVNVTGVKLSQNTLSLVKGNSATLIATVSPSNATNKTVTWTSTNSNVATVDKNGNVKAVSAGTAVIKAVSNNGKYTTCTVTVTNPTVPVQSVIISKNLTINKNKSATLTATVSPSNATNKTVTWSSNNTKVATVDKNGNVKAVSAGTATIKVLSSNGKYSTCTVTVPYTITYKLNGGTNNNSNPLTYNVTTQTITLKNPTRAGYTFSGWYSDNQLNNKVTSIKKGSTKDVTLYAKWTKVSVSKIGTLTLTNVKGNNLKIAFKAISGSKGYEIQYSTDKNFKKSVKTMTTTKTTYTLSKLTKNKTYYVRIRAYKLDSTNKKIYGSYVVKNIKITK
jgi:uncharacterized repeat protein (TIGR02543 family)